MLHPLPLCAREGAAKLTRAGASKELAQPIRAQPGIAQDPGKGSLPDFLVERHDQRVSAPRLLQSHVTAALASNRPAVSLQRPA
jgi:hypothetical protein